MHAVWCFAPRQAPCADGAHDASVSRCSFSGSPKHKRTITWRVSLNTWFVKNLQYMLSTFEIFFVLLSLSWLLQWADFFAFFFSQSRQPLAAFSTDLCTWLHNIRTLWMASCTVLPILCLQETSSRHRHVMHVFYILPGREHKLTFQVWPPTV